jgi:hypothetical protein
VSARAHRNEGARQRAAPQRTRLTTHLVNNRTENVEKGFVVHAGLEGKVDRVAVAVAVAGVVRLSRAGEEVFRLVERNGHHTVRQVEGFLDAVTVMDIDVDVENALVLLEELEASEHDVVGVAEAGCLGLLGVVHPAAPIHDDVSMVVVQPHCAADRP